MSAFKPAFAVMVTAAVLLIASTGEAQTRRHTTTNRGMQGGMGTSPTQSSITAAQNQARMIADRQYQIFAAKRRAEAAARMKAKAEGIEPPGKSKTAKSTTNKPSTSVATTGTSDATTGTSDASTTGESKKPETPKSTTTAPK